MEWLSSMGVTHVSYILILYSVAFMLFLFVNVLLHLYAVHAWPDDETNGRRASRSLHSRSASLLAGPSGRPSILKRYADAESPVEGMNGNAGGMNGKAKKPGNRRTTPSQTVRDAEEFELEGLITDAEDEELGIDPKDRNTSTEAI